MDSRGSARGVPTVPTPSTARSRSGSPLPEAEAVVAPEELATIYAELEEKWGTLISVMWLHVATVFSWKSW